MSLTGRKCRQLATPFSSWTTLQTTQGGGETWSNSSGQCRLGHALSRVRHALRCRRLLPHVPTASLMALAPVLHKPQSQLRLSLYSLACFPLLELDAAHGPPRCPRPHALGTALSACRPPGGITPAHTHNMQGAGAPWGSGCCSSTCKWQRRQRRAAARARVSYTERGAFPMGGRRRQQSQPRHYQALAGRHVRPLSRWMRAVCCQSKTCCSRWGVQHRSLRRSPVKRCRTDPLRPAPSRLSSTAAPPPRVACNRWRALRQCCDTCLVAVRTPMAAAHTIHLPLLPLLLAAPRARSALWTSAAARAR